MAENDQNLQSIYLDAFKESVSIGLGKAASVIAELVDSHVDLSTASAYSVDLVRDLPMSSERLVIMEVEGDLLNGETIFSMSDDQLIKLIRYLEGFDEIDMDDEEVWEIIEDTYQEIGNIILGNIISSIVDFFDIRANINVAYLANKKDIDALQEKKILVVDVMFNIEKIESAGKLYIINDYVSYMRLIKWVNDRF